MLTVPVTLTRLIVRFAPAFSKRVWEHVEVLVVGALLAPGKRTVTAVLRGMGLTQEGQFQKYHRVLNGAGGGSLRSIVACSIGGGGRVGGWPACCWAWWGPLLPPPVRSSLASTTPW